MSMGLYKAKLKKDCEFVQGKSGDEFKYRINRKHGTYMLHDKYGKDLSRGMERGKFNEYFEDFPKDNK